MSGKMPSRYDIMERIRQQASMSKQIVTTKDHEYAWYSGASFEIASKIAKIDTFLKNGLLPKQFIVLIKFYRSYLDQQRKAFFASVGSTEITKLGFLLGLTDDRISAVKQ